MARMLGKVVYKDRHWLMYFGARASFFQTEKVLWIVKRSVGFAGLVSYDETGFSYSSLRVTLPKYISDKAKILYKMRRML